MTRFEVVAETSTVVIQARSTAGTITWEGRAVEGWVEAEVRHGQIDLSQPPSGSIEMELSALTSGNGVYDAELYRRIDIRQHPRTRVALRRARAVDDRGRYQLVAELTFHGKTRALDGAVDVEVMDDHRLFITGERVVDIRDFAVPPPQILMLRIYPDVRVHLFLEARAVDETES